MVSSKRQDSEAIKFLFKKGTDVNFMCRNGSSDLHKAASIEIMINHGSGVSTLVIDMFGSTPLMTFVLNNFEANNEESDEI